MKKTIAIVITTFNSDSTIERTLESVKWADEIIVVDATSSDDTKKKVLKYTKNFFLRPNNPMLNTNKNYGFTKAKSDWIISLDSDEVVSPELESEIKELTVSTTHTGFWIPRKNIIFGKWIQHGLWWPDRQMRLFKNGSGKFPCVHIHEYISVEGTTDTLTEALIHYNYSTISQFIRKMDTLYTENEVSNHQAVHAQLEWSDAIRFPVSDFVKIFFAQQGYKDGLHGLVLSLLQAFYSFIVFAKLWERQGFKEESIDIKNVSNELRDAGKQISYWDLTTKIENSNSTVKRLLYRMLRRYGTK